MDNSMELEQELYLAARDGDTARIRELLKQGANLHSRDPTQGQTALFGAAANGHADAIELLYQCGADINATNKDGMNALAVALSFNRYDSVRALHSLGVDLNQGLTGGIKPIHVAVSSGHESMVVLLYDLEADINATDSPGCNSYWYAIAKGSTKLIFLLHKLGCDFNRLNSRGMSAIGFAAEKGSLVCVKALHKLGADAAAASPTGSTLMHAAASGGAEELIRFIHSIGVNVNCTDESGATPLFYAVDKGNDDAVDALLLLGADVNASRQDGSTPLIAAVQGKRASTVKLLCDRGADTCLANEESGLTALHAAASGNNSEIIKLLVGHGADKSLDAEEADGCTPVHVACYYGSAKAVKMLNEFGASIGVRASDGSTGLHYAAGNGHDDVIRALCHAGADMHATDNEGRSAVHIAAHCGNLSSIKLLQRYGVNLVTRDNSGAVPLHLAALAGHADVMNYLQTAMSPPKDILPPELTYDTLLIDEPTQDKPGAEAKPRCVVCGSSSSSRCGRCKAACYCSRACQTKDWRLHKDTCIKAEKDLVSDAVQNGIDSAKDPTGHYDDTSMTANYENAFFYSDTDYRNWLLSLLLPYIDVSGNEGQTLRVADIGGGTGNFTQALAEALGMTNDEKLLCIDPFEDMLKHSYGLKNVEPVLMDAITFSQTEKVYDIAIAKEFIHHIDVSKFELFFSGVYRQLRIGGSFIIITRPQEVEYPMFPRALEIWRDNQWSLESIQTALENVGFKVDVNFHAYPVVLAKEKWLGMVRSRFWSTFSHCTEEELTDGLLYIEDMHRGSDTLYFDDKLIFIVCRKLL